MFKDSGWRGSPTAILTRLTSRPAVAGDVLEAMN